MGGCFSSPGQNSGSKGGVFGKKSSQPPLEPSEWTADTAWAESVQALCQAYCQVDADDVETRAALEEQYYDRVRAWLVSQWPDCAAAGTVTDMGGDTDGLDDDAVWSTKSFLVLDECFTGVVYAMTKVYLPRSPDDARYSTPGALLESSAMEEGKAWALMMMQGLNEANHNVRFAVVDIFMGANRVTCRIANYPKRPTWTVIDPSNEHEDLHRPRRALVQESSDTLAKTGIQTPDAVRGHFYQRLLASLNERQSRRYRGSALWDEGNFSFQIGDEEYAEPYGYPARLFVGRRLSREPDFAASAIRDAAVFRVWPRINGGDGDGGVDRPGAVTPIMLLFRAPEDGSFQALGGIVSVTLVISVRPEVVWPTHGSYVKSPAFKEAEAAVREYVEELWMRGRTQRCVITICMGTDEKLLKFNADDLVLDPATRALDPLRLGPRFVVSPASFDAYHVRLERIANDTTGGDEALFASEAHFQAVKQHVSQRAAADPDRFTGMMPQVALGSALHVLALNFPQCTVTDEGPISLTLPACGETDDDGAEARLVVVRDPEQEPSSVVAAVNVVSKPRAGMRWAEVMGQTWLDTPEMEKAEAALLRLLKDWYAEGKVSRRDCMAQVMMGVDATIYQFVEGQRFVDYSDERMAQYQWG